jgi:hypothetical protein
MKRLVILIVCLLSCVFITNYVFAQPKDVKGWGKTQWGMSKEKIIDLYPGEVVPRNDPKYPDVKLDIKNLKIDSYVFHAIFIFSPDNKLTEVKLSPPAEVYDATFTGIEQMLVAKYGAPAYRNKRPVVLGGIRYESTWAFPSTVINLNYASELKMLVIIYQPKSKSANDKL